MKMTTNLRATLVAVEANPSNDGKNIYYKIAISQGAEVATLSCTKDVFEAKPEPFKNYDFDLLISEYEGKPTFRITRVSDIPVYSSARPTGVKPDGATK